MVGVFIEIVRDHGLFLVHALIINVKHDLTFVTAALPCAQFIYRWQHFLLPC